MVGNSCWRCFLDNWLASLNGKIMPLSEVRISPMDRGFLFGDAVYEAMRIYSGKAFLEDAHMARLRRSLDCLRISGADVEKIRGDVRALVKASGEDEACVYLQVTRGTAATRTHAFPVTPVTPTVFMFNQPFNDPQSGLRRNGGACITQPDQRWARVDIKTVNLLGNVLAAQASKEADAMEAILINRDGEVTEGTHTNVFGVVNGVLRTKPLSHAILPGISRDFVLDLARKLEIVYEERALTEAELRGAQELFLTATTMEVMPVVRLDGKPVGAGTPGPITVKLREAFSEALVEFRNSAQIK